MNNSNGIDPTTGLPDLSLLGDDLYWEISRNYSGNDCGPDTYSIRIKKNVLVRKKGFFRDAKFIPHTIRSKTISRDKTYHELTPEVVQKLYKFAESYWRGVDTTAREVFENTSTMLLVERSVNLTHRIYFEDLIEYNLSDDLVQLCAMDLFNELVEEKKKELEKELKRKTNEKYVGKYPPKKIG